MSKPWVPDQFFPSWRRFGDDAKKECERLGIFISSVYRPTEKGIGSLNLDGERKLLVDKAWKLLYALRDRGWSCRLVRGQCVTLTVDLNLAPAGS